jgi:metal-sulfur cluster biosynthetic enzyme
MGPDSLADRREQVWDRLRTVTDPELDESVVDLDFITAAEVDAEGCVRVGFRLPTYWCAANFSYMMADDMHVAVGSLPWVKSIEVTLGEHMYADRINSGLAGGLSFLEAFAEDADGDLTPLRRTFLVKAFQRRQAALLDYLLAAGRGAAELVDLTLDELASAKLDAEGDRLRARYLDRRDVVGAANEAARAFVDAEGDRLQAETLSVYLRAMRRVAINAEFNGALCRGLLRERFDLAAAAGCASDEPAQERVDVRA